jgi:polar amino acid transport system substrate-binding protein
MKRFFSRLIAPAITGLAIAAATLSPASAEESVWTRINETKTLKLGVAPYTPFSYMDPRGGEGGVKRGNDTWRGIAVMLGKEVADNLGVELELVELSWAGAIAAIQTNQVDLMFGLDGTPQRAMAVEFIHTPLYKYGVVFFGREDLNANSWDFLNNPEIKLGIVNGTNFDNMLRDFAPNANVQRFPPNSEVLAAFQTDQIDGTVTSPSAADIAKAKMGKGHTVLLEGPEIFLPILAAIPTQADQRWRHYLETTFAYMRDVGTTREIYQQEVATSGIKPEDVSVGFIR